MNIICIDDEELILKLTVSMCKEISMVDEVEGFTCVEKALEYLEGHKADIALLDIDMPEMDGITLALKLKQLYPQLSLLFLDFDSGTSEANVFNRLHFMVENCRKQIDNQEPIPTKA